MEDLAGLLLAIRVDALSLVLGEVAQDAAGDLRVCGQQLKRGDEPIAPERHCKPRQACSGVQAGWMVFDKHPQVVPTLVEQLVESGVVGPKQRTVGRPGPVRGHRARKAGVEAVSLPAPGG